jgi:hypothetical protein
LEPPHPVHALARSIHFTPGLVHWFTKPYILSLAARVVDVNAATAAAAAGASTGTPPPSHPTPAVTITRTNFLGRRVTAVLPLASITPPAATVHPQVTFSDGEGKLYYVDADNWPSAKDGGGMSAAAQLLVLLTPKEEEGVHGGGQ